MHHRRLLVLLLLATAILAWVMLDAGRLLGIEWLQGHYAELRTQADAHPLAAPLLHRLRTLHAGDDPQRNQSFR